MAFLIMKRAPLVFLPEIGLLLFLLTYTTRSYWNSLESNSFIIDSFDIKSQVLNKLLDNIDFNRRSILFIIEKKEYYLTFFSIGKNIERDDSCAT